MGSRYIHLSEVRKGIAKGLPLQECMEDGDPTIREAAYQLCGSMVTPETAKDTAQDAAPAKIEPAPARPEKVRPFPSF